MLRYERTKRWFDIVAVTLVSPLVVPVAAAVAVAIRIDSPGPVMFTQDRTGQDGRRFRMYKFRTMVVDAEERKAELQHLNELPWPDFKITDDPRVTRVGRFLRASSLDELPQLINVLKGDMSLVGPRPTSFAADTYDLWHTVRLEVRPGLTGLWQIEARHSSSFDERLRLDVAYVRTRTIINDVRILMRTVLAVVYRKGV